MSVADNLSSSDVLIQVQKEVCSPCRLCFLYIEKYLVDYHARDWAVTTSTLSSRKLLSVKQSSKSIPLLPVLPTSPPETLNLLGGHNPFSPSSGFTAATSEQDYAVELQRPEGPWNCIFSLPLLLDDTSFELHPTYTGAEGGYATIQHHIDVDVVVRCGSVPANHEGKSTGLHVSDNNLHTIRLSLPTHILSVSGLPSLLT